MQASKFLSALPQSAHNSPEPAHTTTNQQQHTAAPNMSRIGKIPVSIPAGVKVAVVGQTVNVEGPKGKLSKTFASVVTIKVEGAEVHVKPAEESRFAGAMHGTARAIIGNMVKGVTEGYSKKLEIEGVGFKAILKGDALDLALGYSHPILYKLPAGITVNIQEGTKLEVTGADKEAVGKVAAEVKAYYPVEPYKGKGVRIVGQFVRRKEGKKTA
jgi:large subunit ribosomal protein L6